MGIGASASAKDVTAAYRRKARLLHPDVPVTGDTNAFVLVKQAYDILSKPQARADYDRAARRTMLDRAEPGEIPPAPDRPIQAGPIRTPRFSDLPRAAWLVLGSILVIGVVQVIRHLTVLAPTPQRQELRANAPTVAPASPEAQRLSAYGPPPVHLPGTPNFYVLAGAGPIMVWRKDEQRNALVPAGQIPPFSAVQALRLVRQNGLMEVRISEQGNGFIEAGRLTPGNAAAAHTAYCAYNAGPAPGNGEILRLLGGGKGRLELDNRTTQPAVVKLRDAAGAVVLSIYLAPSAHVDIDGLPDVRYRPEFAIGELWSRACQSFAAGMRAQRLAGMYSLNALTPLTIPPDLPGEPPPADISDQAFERD